MDNGEETDDAKDEKEDEEEEEEQVGSEKAEEVATEEFDDEDEKEADEDEAEAVFGNCDDDDKVDEVINVEASVVPRKSDKRSFFTTNECGMSPRNRLGGGAEPPIESFWKS